MSSSGERNRKRKSAEPVELSDEEVDREFDRIMDSLIDKVEEQNESQTFSISLDTTNGQKGKGTVKDRTHASRRRSHSSSPHRIQESHPLQPLPKEQISLNDGEQDNFVPLKPSDVEKYKINRRQNSPPRLEPYQPDEGCAYLTCFREQGERLRYCRCSDLWHYMCVAEWIVLSKDKPCGGCNSKYWDPKDRIRRFYSSLKEPPLRFIRRKYKQIGFPSIAIIATILLIVFIDHQIWRIFFALILICEVCMSFAMAVHMFIEFRDRSNSSRLTIMFKEWPESDVFPNDIRTENFIAIQNRSDMLMIFEQLSRQYFAA